MQCHLPFAGVGETHKGKVMAREGCVRGRGHGLLKSRKEQNRVEKTNRACAFSSVKEMEGGSTMKGRGSETGCERQTPEDCALNLSGATDT